MKELDRINAVLSKLDLDPNFSKSLIQMLLEGEARRMIHLSLVDTANNFELKLPKWFPEKLKFRVLDNEQQAGYSLDMSSVFMLSPLSQVFACVQGKKVLDVCAAPGGKSILANIICEPSHIFSNEKSRERFMRLKSNVSRLEIKNIEVLNMDARQLKHLNQYDSHLVLVDAPCTGQALVGKGFRNFSAFGAPQIRTISAMQRAILSSSSQRVSESGYLLYSTCTFSREENEDNIKWFLKKHPDFQSVEVPFLSSYQSKLSNAYCYRLYPTDGSGAGGFTCLMRKT